MPKSVCRKCGKEGECTHLGLVSSGDSMYDGYKFKCLSCDYMPDAAVYGGSASWSDWRTSCPFCEREDKENTIWHAGKIPSQS